MSFSLSEDEREFQASVRKCFETEITTEYRRRRLDAPKVSDPALWDKIIQFGLIDLFCDKQLGTFSMLSVVSEETGRALIPEAVIERLFFAAYLQGKNDFISGGICNQKGSALCLGGTAASSFLLLSGEQSSLVDKPAVTVKTIDPLVSAALVEWQNEKTSPLINATKCYRLLKACEMYGACSKVVEMTIDYIKTRKQYGVPIGGFQAVQHQLADAYVSLESLRALSRFAVWSYHNDKSQFKLASLSAIHFAANAGSKIIETCLQLHGGIGFTWEYDLHLYLRRVKLIEQILKIGDEEIQDLCSDPSRA